MKLVQLQSKKLRDLVPQIAQGLEIGYLQLPLYFVVHVKAIDYRYDLRFDIIESLSD
jgi:hypothetical protein